MEPNDKVWRYLPFSRFIWLVQNQKLWLSRTDLLEDPWELAVTGQEISYLAVRRPISELGVQGETFLERTKRVLETWRTTTFINCWCARQEESHALWRVFCGKNEGVAIQSTWQKLQDTAQNLRVVPVDYTGYDQKIRPPQQEQIAIRKRRMFDYEHEVRIIARSESPNPTLVKGEFGLQLPFDAATFIESIVVHPESDASFFEVVVGIVDAHIPALKDRIARSAMAELPPAIQVPQQ